MNAGTSFSVRFVHKSDQVYVDHRILNESGDGNTLFQVVDPTSGTIVPNWDATGKSGTEEAAIKAAQPIIRLIPRSSAGYPVSTTSVAWKYDNTTLAFTFNGENWVTATNDSRFQGRISGDCYELRIVKNLASASDLGNKQISYALAYRSNGISETVEGSIDVLIQAGGTNSHIVQISTDRGTLDDANPTALLTAVAYYGTTQVTVGQNGYTLKWYQDGVEISGQTSSSLTVTRAMLEGGSVFGVKLFLNGVVVAQDGQRINDIADEYQIQHTPTSAGANYVSEDHNASFTLSVTKNGTAISDTGITYAWRVYNAINVDTTASSQGTGGTVTVTAANCLVTQGGVDYYANCDVKVSATI